jgi:hypothetical protein
MELSKFREKIKTLAKQVYSERSKSDDSALAYDELVKFPELKRVIVDLLTADFISSYDIQTSFSSSYILHETQYKCTLLENEFNYSLNKSINSDSDGKIYDHFTGSYFAPYITTIGLYNEQQELMAVGKLSQPLPTSRTTDMSILLNLDIL